MELLTPTAFARRYHLDRRTVLRWCREDPDFPAVRVDRWPGHDKPRWRIIVDRFPDWVAQRRAREWPQAEEAP
jgi:hypothetical protein